MEKPRKTKAELAKKEKRRVANLVMDQRRAGFYNDKKADIELRYRGDQALGEVVEFIRSIDEYTECTVVKDRIKALQITVNKAYGSEHIGGIMFKLAMGNMPIGAWSYSDLIMRRIIGEHMKKTHGAHEDDDDCDLIAKFREHLCYLYRDSICEEIIKRLPEYDNLEYFETGAKYEFDPDYCKDDETFEKKKNREAFLQQQQ